MSRIITVFGATGQQGSSVANALLSDGTFNVRAITRNTLSEAAQNLKERGAEVVQADLNDAESLKAALAGSEGVFGVTNPGDPAAKSKGPDVELVQGKLLIDISKEVGVRFFVWSSLPNTTKLSGGKYPNVAHFYHKALVDEYLAQSGLPYAIVHTGWFAENIAKFKLLREARPGSYKFIIPRAHPNTKFVITWIERDLGASVLAVFKNYVYRKDDVVSKTFVVGTARTTYPELAQLISRVIGKPVEFFAPPAYGMPAYDEMFDFINEFGFHPETIITDERLVSLGVKFSTLKEYVETYVKPTVN